MIERARETARASAVTPPFVPTVEPEVPLATAEGGTPSRDSRTGQAEPDPSVAEPVAPTRLVLDSATFTELGENTRAVLTDVGVREGDSVSLAVNRLVAEGARVGAAQAATAPQQRVTRVGGSLWVASPVRQSSATERFRLQDDRTVSQYGRFWGDYPAAGEQVRCRVRPLGIGDFRRVEQEPTCWVPGEVAHIENVLHGETKERTTQSKTTVETFSAVVSEEETTTERDTQTTDRFELEKEVAKTMEQSLKLDIGVNVSAQYGPVKIIADTKFATSTSTKEADKQAPKYAKEVTDRTWRSS